MRLIFVAALVGLATWLSRSPRARELARVSRAGDREEGEHGLAGLLG
jgi:hypothetical protein